VSTARRPYKQVARARAQERTREALLDAAVEEFYGDRWGQASLEALATRAGVTEQTLLRHFGAKEQPPTRSRRWLRAPDPSLRARDRDARSPRGRAAQRGWGAIRPPARLAGAPLSAAAARSGCRA
jgi:AraC-like DNA-binding protein